MTQGALYISKLVLSKSRRCDGLLNVKLQGEEFCKMGFEKKPLPNVNLQNSKLASQTMEALQGEFGKRKI